MGFLFVASGPVRNFFTRARLSILLTYFGLVSSCSASCAGLRFGFALWALRICVESFGRWITWLFSPIPAIMGEKVFAHVIAAKSARPGLSSAGG